MSGAMNIIVIGAGPAGLTTALGLAKLGGNTKVLLVEKRQDFPQRGATFGIKKNGSKALKELCPDLWTQLEEVGIAFPGGGGLMLPWWELRDAALEQVRSTENIELHTGETFTSIIDSGDSVQVLFESGLALTGDFLVGADGVHSDVREWLGLPPALETGSTVFRGSLTVQDDSSEALRAVLDRGLVPLGAKQLDGVYFIVFNFHSKTPGRLAWVLSTTRTVDESTTPLQILEQVISGSEEIELLREIFELSDPEHLKPFPSTKVVDFSDKVLSSLEGRWGGRGRVTLVSDAAHAMRPTDGQGGNQAFEDAVVLSRVIQSANSNSIPDALQEFETERLPRVKRIHDDQRIRYEKRIKGEALEPMSKEFRDWIEEGV